MIKTSEAIENKTQNKPMKKEADKKEGSIFKVKPIKTQNVPLIEQGCIR